VDPSFVIIEKSSDPEPAKPRIETTAPHESHETTDGVASSWTSNLRNRFLQRPALLAIPLVGIGVLVYTIITVMGGQSEAPASPAIVSTSEFPQLEMPKVSEEPVTIEKIKVAIHKAEHSNTPPPPDFSLQAKKKKNLDNRDSARKQVLVIRERAKSKVNRVAKRPPRKKRPEPASKAPPEEVRLAAPVDTTTVIRRTSSGIVVEQVPRKRLKPVPEGLYGPAGFAEREGEKKITEKENPSFLPVGTTLEAKLQVGISSAFRGAQVLARVTKPVEKEESVLLPSGTTLTGRMSAGDDRIFIDFNKATTPEGSTIELRGYAVSGKLPGIPARVTVQEDSSGDSSYITRGAVRTAQGALFGVSGTVAHDLVRNVGSEGLSDAQREVYKRPARTLELSAGTKFRVVVTD
jgi:type IV secretory pathway VirB10-like protein